MPRRLLNIASIVCLVSCVALMGMWVRSYRNWDTLNVRVWIPQGFSIYSRTGEIIWCCPTDSITNRLWEITSTSLSADDIAGGFNWQFNKMDWEPEFLCRIGFAGQSQATATAAMIPYYFPVFASGFLAMICRLRWLPRFTLRTLFVAMTFLAVVLGMTAWLDRAWIGK
jgi:hypothetical protein